MKMDNVRIFEGNEVEVFELKTRVLFRNGKKFIWKPINRATGQQEINHVYFGKIVTVIGLETLDRVKISVDNFPQCNGRIFKNQFVADKDELEELTEN
jgi:DNA modification methylase